MMQGLYRGKRIDNGEWVEGWLVKEPDGTAWISKYHRRGEWVQVDPATVVKNIGVSDRYLCEVYSGDIVKDEKGRVGEVEYVPEHAAFLVRTIDGDGQCYQRIEAGNGKNLMTTIKIGNIWDNPELLGVR